MNYELPLSFDTPSSVLYSSSPVNTKKFAGDNLIVFDELTTGKRINRTQPKMLKLTLHSRISDLTNKFGMNIPRDWLWVEIEGKKIKIREYWMAQEEIDRYKNQFQ